MEPDKVVVQSVPDDEDNEPEDLAGKLADKIPGKDWGLGWTVRDMKHSLTEMNTLIHNNTHSFHSALAAQDDSKGASMEDVEDEDDEDDAFFCKADFSTCR